MRISAAMEVLAATPMITVPARKDGQEPHVRSHSAYMHDMPHSAYMHACMPYCMCIDTMMEFGNCPKTNYSI